MSAPFPFLHFGPTWFVPFTFIYLFGHSAIYLAFDQHFLRGIYLIQMHSFHSLRPKIFIGKAFPKISFQDGELLFGPETYLFDKGLRTLSLKVVVINNCIKQFRESLIKLSKWKKIQAASRLTRRSEGSVTFKQPSFLGS